MSKTPSPDDLMTVGEIAKMFKVKPATVRLWIRRPVNPLPAVKVGDHGHYRVRRHAVESLAQTKYGDKS